MKARIMSLTGGVAALLLTAGSGVAAVTIETVPVGNPGNAPDTRYETPGYGAVDYVYNIGKYEVSNAEYVEFLNAVDAAGTDPYDLYSNSMGSGFGGITFTGGDPNGSKYSVCSGRGNMPVNYVSFWDACRFANWLHNGQGSGATETGAYTLTADGITNNTVTRNPGSQWAVTSEDEWYKAAYYDRGSSVYYDYPTGGDTAPMAEGPAGTDMVNGSANYNWAVGDLTDVGAYTTKPSDSPYGTFDQGGNVWEWNESVIDVSARCLRGGSFFYFDTYYLHAGHRNPFGPSLDNNYSIGFRVSEVPHPGDADRDGDVDLADLSILAFNWDTQTGATWEMGDFDADGDVDLADLSALAANWEYGVTSPPIPEPATLALLALGGLAVIRRRR